MAEAQIDKQKFAALVLMEFPDRLREIMPPELRQGWDDAISYLEKLLGKRSS